MKTKLLTWNCFASADISLTCHHYKPVTDFLYIVSLTALLYNESMTMMDVAIRLWTVVVHSSLTLLTVSVGRDGTQTAPYNGSNSPRQYATHALVGYLVLIK